MAQLGDFDDAARGFVVNRITGPRGIETLLLPLGFAIGGIREHVDANGKCIGNVRDDIGRVVAPLARARELPVAGEILVAVDDTSAATIYDAIEMTGVRGIGANHILHSPDGMTGRNWLKFVF